MEFRQQKKKKLFEQITDFAGEKSAFFRVTSSTYRSIFTNRKHMFSEGTKNTHLGKTNRVSPVPTRPTRRIYPFFFFLLTRDNRVKNKIKIQTPDGTCSRVRGPRIICLVHVVFSVFGRTTQILFYDCNPCTITVCTQ